MAQREQVIQPEILESICKILGEQNTGSEIGHYLSQIGIQDTDPGIAKWKRLYNAFAHYQNKTQRSNRILIYITTTLNPVRYLNNKNHYEQLRSDINKPLSFLGYELLENGKLRRSTKVTTISEAEQRADRLKNILKEREVHHDVLRFCKAELLQDNFFMLFLKLQKVLQIR